MAVIIFITQASGGTLYVFMYYIFIPAAAAAVTVAAACRLLSSGINVVHAGESPVSTDSFQRLSVLA